MAIIVYNITSGTPPFEVKLYNDEMVLVDSVSGIGALGQYSFIDVEDGDYTIEAIDSLGCEGSIEINVDCIPTTTSTTTVGPPITTTTTTIEAGTTTTTTTVEGEEQPQNFPVDSYSGTIYYVSNDGSDSNNGTSPETSWETVEKVNSSTFNAGDAILFKAGDEFEGHIIVPSTGTSGARITFGAYGYGVRPKLYASVEITGWTLHSGNIYKATVSDSVGQVFLDGEQMRLARYPNTGYFYVTTYHSSTSFTSTDLNSGLDYTDATLIGRTSDFTLYHKAITSSVGQRLELESAITYSMNTDEGFFLTNKLEFLDEAGEWYYDSDTFTLYLWTPNGDSPANYTIRGATVDYGFYLHTKDYITIQDISILHGTHSSIYTSTSEYVTVDNCRILSPDLYGIYNVSDSKNHIYTNNYIYQTGCGIRNMGATVTIMDNIIETIGKFEYINKIVTTHDNYGTGIYLRNGNPTVHYNRILDVGYCGINWRGIGSIKYNFVNGAMLVLGDGGGIYTYNSNVPTASVGSEVMYNIVLNVPGNRTGNTYTYDGGYGIYLDNHTTGVTVSYNTISNASCGYMIHEAGNTTFQYNTVYDTLLGVRSSKQLSTSYIYDNLFFAADRNGDFTWWTDQPQKFQVRDSSLSAYNRNEYYQPYNEDAFKAGTGFLNFTEWQSNTSQDGDSNFYATSLGVDVVELFYNDTKLEKTFYLNGAIAKEVDGTVITTSFTLQPFTSKIVKGTDLELIT